MSQTPIVNELCLYYSAAWNDITNYVYARDKIKVTRGTANQGTTADPAKLNLTLNNRDGRFSNRNPASPLFGLIGRNTPMRYRYGPALAKNFGLFLPQENSINSYATTADTAALDIVGDIDIAVEFTAESFAATQCLVAKGLSIASGTQLSYQVLTGITAGVPHLTFRWSTDGTTVQHVDHTMTALVAHTHMAVRVTMDVNNGASGYTVSFYTSSDGTLSGTWNLDGSATTGSPVTSLFSGSAALFVGGQSSTNFFRGTIHAVVVKNSIGGTAVANPNFNTQTRGTTSFSDAAGRAWTMGGEAKVDYFKWTRHCGEWITSPQQWDTSGTDKYVPIESGGILRRLGQGAQPTQNIPIKAFLLSGPLDIAWSGQSARNDLNTSGVRLWKTIAYPGVTFGTFDLGLGTLGMTLPAVSNTLVRNAFGYMTSGYMNADVGNTASTAIAAAFTFKSDSLAVLSFVCPDYDPSPKEYEVRFRGDGTNMDMQLLHRQFVIDTGVTNTTLGTWAPGDLFTDGLLHTVVLHLTASGSDTLYEVLVDGVSVVSGTNTGKGLYGFQSLHFAYGNGSNAAYNPSDVGIAYVADWCDSRVPADLTVYDTAARAYTGETAADRMVRLCAANSIPLTISGTNSDTMPMGPQSISSSLKTLLDECAAADMGILTDTVNAIGLTYYTRTSLYDQATQFSLDYSTNIFGAPPNPVDDDFGIHNDWTVSNSATGGSAQQTLTSGALSTAAPPNGINAYPTSASVNVETDGPLDDIAGWKLNLSTVDEARYPTLTINLMNERLGNPTSGTNNPVLVGQIMAADITDLVALLNMPSPLAPDEIDQLIYGFSETVDGFSAVIVANCLPASPYRVGVWGLTRWDAENSTVNTPFNTSATSLSIASAAGTVLWTTSAGDFPFDVIIGGEAMVVTNITGSSSPQTFTVTRSVNGVVKSHLAGESVHLYPQYRWAL